MRDLLAEMYDLLDEREAGLFTGKTGEEPKGHTPPRPREMSWSEAEKHPYVQYAKKRAQQRAQRKQRRWEKRKAGLAAWGKATKEQG